jgi:hypothetical protein
MRKRSHQLTAQLTIRFTHPNGSLQREDARPPSGRTIASDSHFVVADLIEAHGLAKVVLNSLQSSALCAALASRYESIALASAFNDYFRDRWLPVDDRFALAMAVPSQDADGAVAE